MKTPQVTPDWNTGIYIGNGTVVPTPRRTFYLNLYDVGQAYGGPEEGGWWFAVGEYLETVGTFATRDEAKAARAKLEETRTAYRMGHGPHDGTGPDGAPDDSYLMAGGRWGEGSVKAFVEDHPGQSFPSERPRYE